MEEIHINSENNLRYRLLELLPAQVLRKAVGVKLKKDDAISKLVVQEDLVKAVATAKDVQTKIYHAQLILAGQKIK